jgi:hypothetical protein
MRTIWINEKLWDLYGTHSEAINDAIKKMIDNTEIKIEVEDTEILISRDDLDNISIDIFEDGEPLGGEFEFLGVFDPSDYPYFFPAFEWDGYIYDMDVFREYLDDEIREQVHAEVAPCSETTFIKTYYNKVKNTELASIFDDEFLSQMRRWEKEEITWY